MKTPSDQVAYVRAESGCSAVADEDLLVLARPLPGAHDEAFRRSRQLTRAFCSRVRDVAAKSSVDRQALAALSDELFSSEGWRGWYLSFCVAVRRNNRLRAFNCGVAGLAYASAAQDLRWLLEPQTLGRKLRRDGLESSPHVEHVAIAAAGKGMAPDDIGDIEAEMSEGATLIATVEPRLLDALSDSIGTVSADAPQDGIEVALDALNNPARSFVLWHPSGS